MGTGPGSRTLRDIVDRIDAVALLGMDVALLWPMNATAGSSLEDRGQQQSLGNHVTVVICCCIRFSGQRASYVSFRFDVVERLDADAPLSTE